MVSNWVIQSLVLKVWQFQTDSDNCNKLILPNENLSFKWRLANEDFQCCNHRAYISV